MKTGIERIAAERQRQIQKEGWTPEHDDEHGDASLALAAICYALPVREMRRVQRTEEQDVAGRGENPIFAKVRLTYSVPRPWPASWHPSWWKPKDRVRDLARAGALLAAEIDRLQRTECHEEIS